MTGFYKDSLGLTWFSWVLKKSGKVLLGFTGFYRVLLGFTGLYRVFMEMDLSDQVVEVAQQYQPHQVRFALSNEDEYIDELRALGLADAYEDVKVGRCPPLFGREFFFCFFFLKFPFER